MFSKEKIMITYTLEKCQSCNFEKKRSFKKGDYLFSKPGKCNSCDGELQIEKIFGEPAEQ